MNKIITIGDLRKALEIFSDDDEVVVDVQEDGEEIGSYDFHVEVVEGLQLVDGSVVAEVRFVIDLGHDPEE